VKRVRGLTPATRVALVALATLVALVALVGIVAVGSFGPRATPGPSPAPATPAAIASPTPSASPVPSQAPSLAPSPSPSATPAASATPVPAGRPTRVAIPSLRIDLPVVNPPKHSTFPLCDVAEYFLPPAFQHPGAGGVTYIYAHARTGMFLPILTTSQRNNGRAMIGKTVSVWTAGNFLYTYEIVRVRRHQHGLDWAYRLPANSLVLQTSETPYRDGTKVMLIARQLGDPVTATLAESRPKPRPVACR
jgi:hypothetical protein